MAEEKFNSFFLFFSFSFSFLPFSRKVNCWWKACTKKRKMSALTYRRGRDSSGLRNRPRRAKKIRKYRQRKNRIEVHHVRLVMLPRTGSHRSGVPLPRNPEWRFLFKTNFSQLHLGSELKPTAHSNCCTVSLQRLDSCANTTEAGALIMRSISASQVTSSHSFNCD